VDVLYNTFVVNRDRERRWIGVGVIREFSKKILNPCEPCKKSGGFRAFRIGVQILSSRWKKSATSHVRFHVGSGYSF
jgi:hypothetical protein